MSVGGGEWAWLSSFSLLYFYCNLICELLHVLIINPKDLTAGHTTIFELALLIDVVKVFIYPKSFVCLFVHSFFFFFGYFLKRVTMQI